MKPSKVEVESMQFMLKQIECDLKATDFSDAYEIFAERLWKEKNLNQNEIDSAFRIFCSGVISGIVTYQFELKNPGATTEVLSEMRGEQ
jgi:hypothetical protein